MSWRIVSNSMRVPTRYIAFGLRARAPSRPTAEPLVSQPAGSLLPLMPVQAAPLSDDWGPTTRLFGCAFWIALLIMSFGTSARAQSNQSNQAWPEISTFVKLNDRMRFYFLATTVKESRDSTEGEFGPNFDFYLKPLRKLSVLSWLPQDESKKKLLLVRIGYRYIVPFTGEDPVEHRGVVEATTRYPLVHRLLLSDRNRMDLRSKGGEFSWRFRNRLTVETEFSLGCVKLNPYARGEIYYDSNYGKVSRNSLIFGSAFPITKHIEFESNFEHQNDSGGSSNRTVNVLAIIVNLYF